MKRLKLHGEVAFYELSELPAGAKPYTPKQNELVSDGRFIVGESETTGNHHVIETHPQKIELYELNGEMYMRVKEDVKVGCVHKDRHDDMNLEPGIYKKKIQKEYDYFEMEKRNVAD